MKDAMKVMTGDGARVDVTKDVTKDVTIRCDDGCDGCDKRRARRVATRREMMR